MMLPRAGLENKADRSGRISQPALLDACYQSAAIH